MSAPPPPRNMRTENKNPLLIIPGFKIGKEGLEKTLEPTLRGTPGGQRVEVTARGKLVKELDPKPDRSGGTVQLTIDAGLHAICGAADRRPVGRASSSSTSRTATSWPCRRCRPSIPTISPTGSARPSGRCCREDDHIRWSTRSLEGLYPSGSTIKPAMALALLNAGHRPQRSASFAPAPIQLGNHIFHCDSGHGSVDMDAAVVAELRHLFLRRCACRVGADKLAPMVQHRWASARSSTCRSPPSATAPCPTPNGWSSKYHREWQGYDTVNMSIGQGYVLVNPLQLAVMAARIATGQAACSRGCSRRKPVAPQPQLDGRPGASRVRPRGDGGRRRPRHRRRRQAAARRHPDGRQDRHRAGPQSQRRASAATTRPRTGGCATTRCSSPSRRPTSRATRPLRSSSMAASARRPPRRWSATP